MKYRWYILAVGLVIAGLVSAVSGQSEADTALPAYPDTEVTMAGTNYSQPIGACLIEKVANIIPSASAAVAEDESVVKSLLPEPIAGTAERVTKLPFGRFVAPGNSPVGSDRFRGYHSAIDLEVLPGEEKEEVEVRAICSGPLLRKTFATGYGGVIIQSCELLDDEVTVVYGHLDLRSIKAGIGDEVKAGDLIGWLGQGESAETDGERKHLHLGIHRGSDINFLGYVQRESDLDDWIDPLPLIAP